jgi:hypothetical protein
MPALKASSFLFKSRARWISIGAIIVGVKYFLFHWLFAQAASQYLTAKVVRATLENLHHNQ